MRRQRIIRHLERVYNVEFDYSYYHVGHPRACAFHVSFFHFGSSDSALSDLDYYVLHSSTCKPCCYSKPSRVAYRLYSSYMEFTSVAAASRFLDYLSYHLSISRDSEY